MKPILTTLTALLFAVACLGQITRIKKDEGSIYVMSIPQYKDTLDCMIRVVDTAKNLTDKWVKAKVVLKNGELKSNHATWVNSYISIAIGPFTNKFITDYPIAGLLVMQISIIDKNPYKTTK